MTAPVDGTIRIAVAGCGRWGSNYVRVCQSIEGCELAGACDPDPRAGKRLARQLGSAPFYDDHRKLLDELKPDALVVATPATLHYRVVTDALDAGAHVLVEKPLTTRANQAAKLVELADKRKKVLMVGHIFHYHSAVQRLESMISAGELGAVRYMYSVRTNLGPIRDDVNVLWDLAAHDVAILAYLADEMPGEVSASGQSYLRPGIADVAFGTLYFRRRRAIGHFQSSWLDPHKVRQLTVIGSKRMAEFDDISTQEPLRVFDRGVDTEKKFSVGDFGQFQLMLRDGDIHIPHVAVEEPLRAQLGHFIECLRTGRSPRTDGRFGLAVVRTLEALDESLRHHGRPVKVR
jgi:predicted dehydrogenase